MPLRFSIILSVNREVDFTPPTFHRTIEKHGVACAGHSVWSPICISED